MSIVFPEQALSECDPDDGFLFQESSPDGNFYSLQAWSDDHATATCLFFGRTGFKFVQLDGNCRVRRIFIGLKIRLTEDEMRRVK